jgi:Family of unknown function (DUF6636)
VLRLPLIAAVVLAASAAVAAGPAGASSSVTSFRTPSKNIYCAWEHLSGSPQVLRCDVRQLTHQAPKPSGCQFDAGSSFGMNPTGRAAALCVSDSVYNPHARAIAYGKSRRFGSFRCSSKTSGLRCTNRSGHGFFLNRTSYKLF